MAIYLDYNASTPIAPEVAEAMQPYLRDGFGNPSSRHWASADLQSALAKARTQVANLLGGKASEAAAKRPTTHSKALTFSTVAATPI